MPTTTHARLNAGALLAVIFSRSEANASHDFAGFWSNTDGWTVRAGATEFAPTEAQHLALPISAAGDARLIDVAEAERLVRTHAVKAAFDADDHEVAQAADGRWYWADRQDMDAGEEGDYPTEEAAWASLCTIRGHVLDDAGISADGLFGLPHAEPDEEERAMVPR